MQRILVDHREKDSAIMRYALLAPEAKVEVTQLDVGDYADPDGKIHIERKSAEDFTASIIDRRLFTQVRLAAEREANLVFLIEGDPFGVQRISPEAVAGAISYLAVVESIPVVMVSNPRESAMMIKTLIRHATDGLGYEINLMPPKPKTVIDQRLFVFSSLPGVGEKTAQELLQHFGSVRSMMAATEADLQAVPGIGKKMAQKIMDVLS